MPTSSAVLAEKRTSMPVVSHNVLNSMAVSAPPTGIGTRIMTLSADSSA